MGISVFSENGKLIVVTGNFKVEYNYADGEDYYTLSLNSFMQNFYIPSCCDTLEQFDLNESLLSFEKYVGKAYVELKWIYRSNLWLKTYTLVCYESYLEYYYTLDGKGKIDTLRYFEGIEKGSFKEHIYLTKHFNDKKRTTYSTYRKASPVGFDKVFNPEPNNYAYQYFNSYETAQISVHADLDFCGGNFIFNPSILCFAVSKDNCEEWLSFGVAPNPGQYLFSEYWFEGGREFGLYLNYWGLTNVNGTFTSPKIIMVAAKDEFSTLSKFVSIMQKSGLIKYPKERTIYDWWYGPIICGWGEQCYMADLFRTRSPYDRNKDLAVYYMCTQGNYEKFLEKIDENELDWRILCIDARWTLSAGEKILDEGRWPNLRAFTDKVHSRGKKVVIWWGMWEVEGLDKSLCICYDSTAPKALQNRNGRFAKFGNLANGDKVAPDPTLKDFQDIISKSLYKLLSEDECCFNVDGLKLDHVAATPGMYGLKYPEGSARLYGIELAKYYQSFLYNKAKKIKEDSLIIGQSANPYFSNCTDMLRLGDIYSTTESVKQHMEFRAKIARIAEPSWLIDMDNWPIPSIKSLEEYIEFQPKYGVPSLYYVSGIDTTGEKISSELMQKIKGIWDFYHKRKLSE